MGLQSLPLPVDFLCFINIEFLLFILKREIDQLNYALSKSENVGGQLCVRKPLLLLLFLVK